MHHFIALITAVSLLLSSEARLVAASARGMERLQTAIQKDRCVAYTPLEYCPLAGSFTNATAQSIRTDLSVLKPYFNLLVTYSCNPDHGLDQVVPVAAELEMRVVLGIWDVRSVREIEAAVSVTRRHSNTVVGIIVGNETQLRGETWGNLESAIRLVRAALPDVPVSTSEPISSYGDDDLRAIVDFHAPICMWIFQGGNRLDAKAAVGWTKERINSLRELPNGGKPILIKEHGLPSGPDPFTPDIQKQYWEMWQKEMPNTEDHTANVFEAYDLWWKPKTNPSDLGATEAFWGAWDGQRQPKVVVMALPKLIAPQSNESQKQSP